MAEIWSFCVEREGEPAEERRGRVVGGNKYVVGRFTCFRDCLLIVPFDLKQHETGNILNNEVESLSQLNDNNNNPEK